ncbi:MAG: cytochrome c oxidase subunit II [Methylomonas sp.]|nr:cytochrome c oxidase subunit II [Methylomonas sp.]PPD21420.1 MAG: cytochrome c oxidase subunit II [Methylomonas sp.]PPD24900.1 MAG: cytochrome c oxidase subunit II [Methylomonas sp.]PPD33898.1 MAG: cytochrome c oxidase subunit II [Methylomonas sp.]PPD41455.1 MAG: cytochrome c oxidase subunit II [Methylomonas sp.]
MKKTKQLLACSVLLASGLESAHADYTLNLVKGVTQLSHRLYDLHMLILWVCVAIGVGVFGTMFYSIYHHRKSKGHQAAQFHESTTVEIIWTIIPTLILIGMAVPATYAVMDIDKVEESEMSIKVTGKQWYWDYEYLDNGIHFESHLDEASEKTHRVSTMDPRSVPNYLLNVDKPLVIPTKTKIRFLFTSSDVIHSWWVPDLGWKKDANPGFVNEAWTYVEKPGTYRGQCTELCGRDHGFMPVVVIAMEQEQYDAWVKTTLEKQSQGPDLSKQSRASLLAKGESVYLKNCVACHQIDGKGISGWYPALRDSGKVIGNVDQLIGFVQAGTSKMPAFKKLPANELAELVTYIRNSADIGNNVNDEFQPCQALTLDDLDELFPDNDDAGQQCKEHGEVKPTAKTASAAAGS